MFLFSEWGRKGIKNETAYTQMIYQKIVDETDAELMPVGAAWEICLAEHAEVELHSPDGNHANERGAFLAACVVYASATGQDPRQLPEINARRVSGEQQTLFKQIAWKSAMDAN